MLYQQFTYITTYRLDDTTYCNLDELVYQVSTWRGAPCFIALGFMSYG